MSGEWTDRLTGARMHVDQRFQSRVQESRFSNQQWGLIMTAVEFRIDDPEDPAAATLVAETDNVRHIIPELEKIKSGMGQPGGQPGRTNGSGIIGKIAGLFGGSSDDDVDEETLTAATDLVEEYTAELQQFLEEEGRWDAVCERAADQQ